MARSLSGGDSLAVWTERVSASDEGTYKVIRCIEPGRTPVILRMVFWMNMKLGISRVFQVTKCTRCVFARKRHSLDYCALIDNDINYFS